MTYRDAIRLATFMALALALSTTARAEGSACVSKTCAAELASRAGWCPS